MIDLEIWEDFVDAMSQTRLEDEYDRAVRESDIFVSLFWTKVGKFTEEEIDSAFGKFKETGRPLVYTYFNDAAVKPSAIEKFDSDSKYAFMDKLKELGHFPTGYNGIDDLKYQFKM